MEKEINYKEDTRDILELLQELLMSMKLQKGAIWEVFVTLPTLPLQHALMKWLVGELKKRTPSEVEIVAKAEQIAEEDRL